MTEKLANLEWYYVVLIVLALLLVRFALIKQSNEFAKSVGEIAESLAIAMALVFFIIRPFLVQAFFIPSGSMRPTLLEDDHILVNKLGYRFFKPQPGDIVVFKAPAEASDDGTERDFIKRLVGVPGDTIEIVESDFAIGNNHYDRGQIRAMFADPSEYGDEIPVKYFPDHITVNGRKITKAEIAKEFSKTMSAAPGDIRITPGKTLRNGKARDEPYTAEDPDYDWGPVTVGEGELIVLGDNRNNSKDSHVWGTLERRRLLGKAMFIFWPIPRIRLVH